MRWELNDLARRLDDRPPVVGLRDDLVAEPHTSGSGLSASARRILDAIDALPEDEREAFDLVRIQGMTHVEAAQVLTISAKTVQRRLNRAMLLLTDKLHDILPEPPEPGDAPA